MKRRALIKRIQDAAAAGGHHARSRTGPRRRVVAPMKRYTVRARRVGNWWALDVEGVHGAHTQVRRIDQAEEMAREAIAGVLDVAPTGFDVVLAPEVPADARKVVAQATRARLHATQAQQAAAKLTQDAARRLVETGLTVRDAGVLLGVSHQRIAQLVGGWHSGAMGPRVDLDDKEAVRRATETA